MNLQVLLNDRHVGTLARHEDERILFVFNEAYANDPHRPTLSQFYLRSDGSVRQDTHLTRTKVPPWFSNLLPEGALREYIARKANISVTREYPLLALLGSDLPGAVRVMTEGTDETESEEPLAAENQDGPLRFSLAGVQLKFSALVNQQGGLTIPAAGLGGDWIVKLPSPNYPAVPENESAMLTLANRAGISVPEHRLVQIDSIEGLPENLGNFAGTAALAVRRFDRAAPNKRIHMEDLAQVFGIWPHEKYEKKGSIEIAELIGRISGNNGGMDFIARLAFIVLTGNGDMHLKNWSLLYPDGKNPILSPAYDLVSTVPYISNEGLAINIAGEKAFSKITLAHFRRLADQAGLPEREALNTVATVTDAVLSAWPEVRKESGLLPAIADKIDDHLKSLPLINQRSFAPKKNSLPEIHHLPSHAHQEKIQKKRLKPRRQVNYPRKAAG